MSPETLNLLRGLGTVAAMIAFIGVTIWAWSNRRKADFDAAAALPLEEDKNHE